MAEVRLEAGPYALSLRPEIGGAIAQFTWRHPDGRRLDLMRPMSETAIAAGNSGDAACFPLFPYSNRIRRGRFTFEGVDYQLPMNTEESNPQHGHGWQRNWNVLERASAQATIGFTHDPAQDPGWPFAYEARQSFALDADGLSVTLLARNRDHRAMPFGFGLHPYFPRGGGARLTATVTGYWNADRDVMPTEHVGVPATYDLNRGLTMRDVVIDNVFTGFGGRAEIDWPEWQTRLVMAASESLGQLVVYVPDQATQAAESATGMAPYFCAEPVSNITDAVNLDRADNGLIVLAPGATVEAIVRFTAEPVTSG
ncbi:aldose 1-epimerase [Dongia sp.]|uniref:aldose 1-epimerase n=1 Tax=Dongia sp. TaxID=1977262 RepID=UPI0035B0931C